MSARITRHTAKRLKTEEASAINPLINHGSDILICIAPYLSVVELVNLSLTNKHFGLSTGDDQLSLMEDVVRQVIINEQTEYEATVLPKYEDESYLQLYHQHKMLRKPLQFDQLVGKNLQYVVEGEEEDKTKVFVRRPANNSTKTAISNNIMRAGKHYVEFTAESFPRNTCVGVMRPVKGWGNKLEKGKPVNHLNPTMLKKPFSVELLATRTERWGESNVNACMYHYSIMQDGTVWSDWQQMGKSPDSIRFETWAADNSVGDGTFSNLNQNTVLGLLLDLDEGMITVYKNGQRRGVMKTGLGGEYVWAVSMESRDSVVGIRRSPIPSDYDPSQNQVIPAPNWWNML